MKVTMYDLLGMVKDGKAPKKIKYNDKIFIYDGFSYIYENKTFNEYNRLEEFISYSSDLNDTVEIIEEEKKIPEKIKSLNNVGNSNDIGKFADKQQLNNHLLKDKLNEVIHYLQYLKRKGDE